MPLPDGTGTALEVGQQLDRLFTLFRPPFRPDDERWASLFREYVSVLQRFPLRSLKLGIDRLVATRKERSAPAPAEIIDAMQDAVAIEQTRGRSEGLRPLGKPDFTEQDNRLRALRIDLAEEFRRNNQSLYEQSKCEGWEALLETAVRAAANILAQRQEKRRRGEEVLPCSFPNIEEIGGREMITIDFREINKWRGYYGLSPEERAA